MLDLRHFCSLRHLAIPLLSLTIDTAIIIFSFVKDRTSQMPERTEGIPRCNFGDLCTSIPVAVAPEVINREFPEKIKQ